jgi:hypothetical protein
MAESAGSSVPAASGGPKASPLRVCCACGGTEGGTGAAKQRRLQLCTGCRGALFCDAACQAAAWAAHRATCRALGAGATPAAHVPARAHGGPPFGVTDLLLPRGDGRLTPGAPASPLLRACGVDLRVVRLTPPPRRDFFAPPNAALDNQLITFFMADARSGLAPPE